VFGRLEGAEGRVLGVVVLPDGRGVAPVLGDDGRAGLTIRGSWVPRLGVEGVARPDVVGGVRTGSLELGVVGLRCSVGLGDACAGVGCGEMRRAAADGDSTPGASLYSAATRGGAGRDRISGR
jgi:hypothetical protein